MAEKDNAARTAPRHLGLWTAPVAGACGHRWVIKEQDLHLEVDGVEIRDGIRIRHCAIRSACPICHAPITIMDRVLPHDVLLRVKARTDDD